MTITNDVGEVVFIAKNIGFYKAYIQESEDVKKSKSIKSKPLFPDEKDNVISTILGDETNRNILVLLLFIIIIVWYLLHKKRKKKLKYPDLD